MQVIIARKSEFLVPPKRWKPYQKREKYFLKFMLSGTAAQ
jgi:hypothetical protein